MSRKNLEERTIERSRKQNPGFVAGATTGVIFSPAEYAIFVVALPTALRLERENGEDIRRSRSKLPTKFKIGYKITSIPVGIAAASSAILMNPITLAITNSLSAGYELVRNSSEQVKSYLP